MTRFYERATNSLRRQTTTTATAEKDSDQEKEKEQEGDPASERDSPTEKEGQEKPEEREGTYVETATGRGSRHSSVWWGGYPSWLPRRPSPPQPTFTMSTIEVPSDLEFGTPDANEFGRRATPRALRVVNQPMGGSSSMSVSPNASPISPLAGRTRRELYATDQTRVAEDPPLHGQSRIVPRFRIPGLRLEILSSPSLFTKLQYYILLPIWIFGHLILQTFFDLNAVYILIQVIKYPSPSIPGEKNTWAIAAAAYITCWTVQIFGIFLLWELVYSFWRRWRSKWPAITPLYLSSSANALVSLTSRTHFSLFAFIRHSALSRYSHPSIRYPSDYIAERCFFFAQNSPTVISLLPRGGISLALLFTFGAEGSGESEFDGVGNRDGTFFRGGEGELTRYARGVLIANAAWTAWRSLVVLGSFIGLWILSEQSCAGLCGPRFRWEEDALRTKAARRSQLLTGKTLRDLEQQGIYEDESGVVLSWEWRHRTLDRIQDAFEMCLTHRPPLAGAPPAGAPRRNGTGNTANSDDSGFLLDQMLSEKGYVIPPMPARRRDRERLLSLDVFDAPEPREKGKGKEVEKDVNVGGSGSVPFPSPTSPTEVGSRTQDERTPHAVDFPPVPVPAPVQVPLAISDPEEETSPTTAAGDGEKEHRKSSSMSSLGQVIPSARGSRQYFPGEVSGHRRAGTGSTDLPSTSENDPDAEEAADADRSQSSKSSDAADSGRVRAVTDPSKLSPGARVADSNGEQRTRIRTISGIASQRGVILDAALPDREVSMIHSDGDIDIDEIEAAERDDSVGQLSPSASPGSSLGGRGRRRKSASGSSSSASSSGRSRVEALAQEGLTVAQMRPRARSAESASASVPGHARDSSGDTSGMSNGNGSSDPANYTSAFGPPRARARSNPWNARAPLSALGAGSSSGSSHQRQESNESGSILPQSPLSRHSFSPDDDEEDDDRDFTFGRPGRPMADLHGPRSREVSHAPLTTREAILVGSLPMAAERVPLPRSRRASLEAASPHMDAE